MKNKIKAAIGIVAIVLSLNVVAYAMAIQNSGHFLLFSEYEILGSEYKLMATGRVVDSPYNTIGFKVDNMYKTDGSTSTYNTSVWSIVNASNGAILQSNIGVTKGIERTITFTESQNPGDLYGINVKGNQTNNDALISGHINHFNRR